MNEDANRINVEEITAALQAALPQAFGQLGELMELLTGNKAKIPPAALEFKGLTRVLRRWLEIAVELEKLGKLPPTPENLAATYQLVNKMMRLVMRGLLPRGVEPLVYLVQQAHKLCDLPPNLLLPSGLNYETKHEGLREFGREVASQVDQKVVDDFLQGAFLEQQLVAQFQRAFGNMTLPKDLKAPSLTDPCI